MKKNLAMNIISFVTNVLIGLWLVPYLIRYLGVAAYGLVPLAMILTDYMNVINLSINGSVARFYVLEVQAGNWKAASSVFSTAFFGMVFLILLQIPILGTIVANVSSIVTVPTGLITDAVVLFGFTFGGYLTSLLSSILNSSMYALNRLDLSQTVSILRIIVRITIIIVLFNIHDVSLVSVGIANFTAAIAVFIFSFYWNRKLAPEVKIGFSFFDAKRLKGIFSMGGWLIVNQIGYLLFLKIDIFLINKLMGASQAGEYAALVQWNGLIRTFAGILSGIFAPVIMIYYARKEIEKVISYTEFSIRYLTIFLVLVCGIISGFAQPILSLWLGDSFANKSNVLSAMLMPLAFAMSTQSVLSVNRAYNKVMIPALVTVGMGVMNFVTSYLLIIHGYGFMGVALSGSIWLFMKNVIFTPIYGAYIMEIPYITLMKSLPVNLVLIVLIYLVSHYTCSFMHIESWVSLMIYSSIVTAFFTGIIYFFLISKKDKLLLIKLVKR